MNYPFNEEYYVVEVEYRVAPIYHSVSSSNGETRFNRDDAMDLYGKLRDTGRVVRVVHIRRDVVCVTGGVSCHY